MNALELAQHTYARLFDSDGVHLLKENMKFIAERADILDKKERIIFYQEVLILLEEDKIKEIQRQKYKYNGNIMMANADEILDLHAELKNSIKNLSNTKIFDDLNIVGIQWLKEEVYLDNLFNKLKGKFIHPDVDLEVFKNVFSSHIEKVVSIQWIKSIVEIVMMFEELNNQGFINETDYKGIICKYALFINKNGEPFSRNSLNVTKNKLGNKNINTISKAEDSITEIVKRLSA